MWHKARLFLSYGAMLFSEFVEPLFDKEHEQLSVAIHKRNATEVAWVVGVAFLK